MMTIEKPGLLTSIQDLGRYGFQKYGVIASGVMDPLSHRMANILVGNEENTPTMEITLLGPVITFHETTLISICGGDLNPSIDGKPIRLYRAVLVKKGSVLRFGSCKLGCRAYLAVAGGFSVPSVMGSKSTYLRAKIGGFDGRALKLGDAVFIDSPGKLSEKIITYLLGQLKENSFVESKWSVALDFTPTYKNESMIRVTKGRQFHLFTDESKQKLFTEPFEVTSQSDRMGYRLKGPKLALEKAQEMISEAVDFGTIQVPAEGNPIVLLADRQTTGGYQKIVQIASVDLPLVAQRKPGDHLRFVEITNEEAQQLLLERESRMSQLKNGYLLKFS